MTHLSEICGGRLASIILGTNALFAPVLIAQTVDAQDSPQKPIELKITARRFEFDPHTITLQVNRPARLIITSEDVTHGFAIDEFNISARIEAKQTKTIEFTPDHVGKFQFIAQSIVAMTMKGCWAN
jgi:cytochrome c oxidase subunit 2